MLCFSIQKKVFTALPLPATKVWCCALWLGATYWRDFLSLRMVPYEWVHWKNTSWKMCLFKQWTLWNNGKSICFLVSMKTLWISVRVFWSNTSEEGSNYQPLALRLKNRVGSFSSFALAWWLPRLQVTNDLFICSWSIYFCSWTDGAVEATINQMIMNGHLSYIHYMDVSKNRGIWAPKNGWWK